MELNHNYAYSTVSKLLFAAIKKSYPEVEYSESQIYESLSAPPNLKWVKSLFHAFHWPKNARWLLR